MNAPKDPSWDGGMFFARLAREQAKPNQLSPVLVDEDTSFLGSEAPLPESIPYVK